MLPTELINDDKISLKAKWLYLYIHSKWSSYNFSITKITDDNESRDWKDSIASAFNELLHYWWIHKNSEKERWERLWHYYMLASIKYEFATV